LSIKKKFIISNVIMLVVPVVLIFFLGMLFVMGFVIVSPAYNITMTIQDLFQPKELLSHIGLFISVNPSAQWCLLIWIIASVIIVVGVITGITVILSKSILNPIRELTLAADKIKTGKLDFEVMRASDEEVDALCKSFDEMRVKLKQSREKEEAYKAERSMLLANLSHDLKTPITSIKGYVEGIQDGVADTPDKMERYLRTIYAKANAIDEMVNNLSVFSKLEMNKLQFDFELGDINQFLRDILEECKLDLQKNNMTLHERIPNKQVIIKIDYQKMHRVIVNLIENAMKYKEGDKGELSVSTEVANGGVFIKVSDRGIGISQSELKKVFEGFYRSDPSRTPNIKGSGLGLGIAREIIEQHGGKIWIKSENGTTVFMYLPVRQVEQ
jgi:signal transduction histidine kinase